MSRLQANTRVWQKNVLQREGLGQLPVAGLAEGWQASVLENFAIKILFKISPIEALMSYLGIERALPLNERILS